MKKIQAKTPIKIQNFGLGLNTKNVPHPQKITLDQKDFFLISKGPPFYASTFWHFGKSQLYHFTSLSISFLNLALFIQSLKVNR